MMPQPLIPDCLANSSCDQRVRTEAQDQESAAEQGGHIA